jgi:hypothetical protein
MYNQNEDLVVINENFINGFLTPIALLKDYTTYEVGFNYYFKKIGIKESIEESLFKEFRNSFKYFGTYEKGEFRRSKSEAEVENLIEEGIALIEIENWENELLNEIDFWTGTSLTNVIKEENKMRAWSDKPNLLSIELIELIKAFFKSSKFRAFKYQGTINNDLYYHWGGIQWLDIIFSNSEENYILHFDLSD